MDAAECEEVPVGAREMASHGTEPERPLLLEHVPAPFAAASAGLPRGWSVCAARWSTCTPGWPARPPGWPARPHPVALSLHALALAAGLGSVHRCAACGDPEAWRALGPRTSRSSRLCSESVPCARDVHVLGTEGRV